MVAFLRSFFYDNADVEVNCRELKITILGISLLFYGIFAMIFAMLRGHPSEMFWICYISMFFLGIATLRGNSFIIAGFLNISLIPLIFWNIDFLVQFITGRPFLGITDFFFNSTIPATKFISISHFFLAPLMLYLLYLIKLRRMDSWKLSISILVILAVVSLAFSNPTNNVNCVFDSCVSLLGGSYYQIKWLISVLGMSIITASVINRFSIFFVQQSLGNK